MSSLLTAVINVLNARRVSIEQAHGVFLVGVAGSVARGQDGPNSDVDIVYRVTGRPTLYDLVAVVDELEMEIGRRVDLVDLSMMRVETRAGIENDLVSA